MTTQQKYTALRALKYERMDIAEYMQDENLNRHDAIDKLYEHERSFLARQPEIFEELPSRADSVAIKINKSQNFNLFE